MKNYIHVSNEGPEKVREAIVQLISNKQEFSVTLFNNAGIHSFKRMPDISQRHLMGINTRGQAVRLPLDNIRDVDEKEPKNDGGPFHQAMPSGTDSNTFC